MASIFCDHYARNTKLGNSEEIYVPPAEHLELGSQFDYLDTCWKQKRNFQCFNTAFLPQNVNKNRFNNILPYDDNLLPGPYINASPIVVGEKTYIATQAPMPSTFSDFYSMLIREDCSSIVCLTTSQLDDYWSSICISSKEYYSQNLYTKSLILTERILRVTSEGKSKEVVMYHYQGWPDGRSPNFKEFCFFRNHVSKNSPSGNVVVHCSAGVGRTGTYIAIEKILDSVVTGEILLDKNNDLSIYSVTNQLRSLRYGSVSTHCQYIFIYDYIMSKL